MGILIKLIKLVPLNIAGVIGVAQGVIKVLKEVCTLIVENIFPFTSDNGKFEEIIKKVRSTVDILDAGLQKVKDFLLGTAGL